MPELLAATRNKHKVEEIKAMLAQTEFDVEILTLDDIDDFPEIIEDADTFEGNAEKKALEAEDFTGIPSFADDSGLEVDALDGAPGVLSARYAGEGATGEQLIAKLLKEMDGVENRKARFVCVIAVAWNGEVVGTFRGEVNGVIADAPRGTNGFGYDPVFIPDGYDQTFGELGSDVKDKISHRANAIAKVREFIEDEMAAMEDFDIM